MYSVCNKVLEAAATVINAFDVPLESLLHFISAFPREFTDYGGEYVCLMDHRNQFLLLSFINQTVSAYEQSFELPC